MTFRKKWKLYEMINKLPYKGVYYLSTLLSWSVKKTQKYLDKLVKDGMIEYKEVYDLKLYYPVHWRDLMDL